MAVRIAIPSRYPLPAVRVAAVQEHRQQLGLMVPEIRALQVVRGEAALVVAVAVAHAVAVVAVPVGLFRVRHY